MLIPYIEMEQLKRDIMSFFRDQFRKHNHETDAMGLEGLVGLEQFEFDFTYFLEGKLLGLERFLLPKSSASS